MGNCCPWTQYLQPARVQQVLEQSKKSRVYNHDFSNSFIQTFSLQNSYQPWRQKTLKDLGLFNAGLLGLLRLITDAKKRWRRTSTLSTYPIYLGRQDSLSCMWKSHLKALLSPLMEGSIKMFLACCWDQTSSYTLSERRKRSVSLEKFRTRGFEWKGLLDGLSETNAENPNGPHNYQAWDIT